MAFAGRQPDKARNDRLSGYPELRDSTEILMDAKRKNPPTVSGEGFLKVFFRHCNEIIRFWQTLQRPTLPSLET